MFSFLLDTIVSTVKSWHQTSSMDAKVYFLLDKEKTQTIMYPAIVPIVNMDKVYTFLLNFQL